MQEDNGTNPDKPQGRSPWRVCKNCDPEKLAKAQSMSVRQMVTDQYSHILDEDRVHNTQLFEEAFYQDHSQKTQPVQEPKAPENSEGNTAAISPELMAKVLQSPELVALIQAIGQTNNNQ